MAPTWAGPGLFVFEVTCEAQKEKNKTEARSGRRLVQKHEIWREKDKES